MRKYPRDPLAAVPVMMTRLALSSWETIWRRSLMMANGTCTLAEYQRMSAEKIEAVQLSMLAFTRGGSPVAMLAPFASRTRANAKRLRRQG